ncbi:MAG TPA: ABC transporter permease [Candidatus Limnocylindria bacterium]|jgi:osmoprotectant transport system permease protein|nr:ABC transporter permease [Candidatus Limnocylindria bacterium]
MNADEPFIRFDWIIDNLGQIGQRLGEHVLMVVASVLIGFVISFGLALLARSHRWTYGPIIAVTSTLYAIPSLALFVLLIPITGLSLTTGIVALVLYTLLILVRNIVVALDGVPPEVVEAATGMGYGPLQRFWRVELPVATPVIVAGLRIATVTTVGLVAITTFIGLGGLGYLIINSGTRRFFPTSIYVGVALCVVLAVVADLLLLWLQRRLTPWAAAQGR